jgi:uncharacterized membrane protein (DUF485 family)
MSENISSQADAHRSPNQTLGLLLFAVYFLFYAGFIAITVYDYALLGREVFAGVNLAIVYGMGLILLAIVLAVVYAFFAKSDPAEATEASEI